MAEAAEVSETFTPLHPGEVVAVVAVSAGGIIGADGDQPWSHRDDFARFKAITMGQVLIMGRRTYDAIGRALPGRHTIVLTRDHHWIPYGKGADSVRTAHTWEQALALAQQHWPDSGIVIGGGGEVYRLALPATTRVELTAVDADFGGDVTFPELSATQWRQVAAVPRDGFSWLTYHRVG